MLRSRTKTTLLRVHSVVVYIHDGYREHWAAFGEVGWFEGDFRISSRGLFLIPCRSLYLVHVGVAGSILDLRQFWELLAIMRTCVTCVASTLTCPSGSIHVLAVEHTPCCVVYAWRLAGRDGIPTPVGLPSSPTECYPDECF